MSRQVDNLKRLLRKFQARYGDQDWIVLQVKHELDSREGLESEHPHWANSSDDASLVHGAALRQDAISRRPPRSTIPSLAGVGNAKSNLGVRPNGFRPLE